MSCEEITLLKDENDILRNENNILRNENDILRNNVKNYKIVFEQIIQNNNIITSKIDSIEKNNNLIALQIGSIGKNNNVVSAIANNDVNNNSNNNNNNSDNISQVYEDKNDNDVTNLCKQILNEINEKYEEFVNDYKKLSNHKNLSKIIKELNYQSIFEDDSLKIFIESTNKLFIEKPEKLLDEYNKFLKEIKYGHTQLLLIATNHVFTV